MAGISSSDPGLQPGDLFGDYSIASVAGRGGMAVVYKAVHVRLQRLVALKLLRADLSSDPAFRERFLREATLAASIRRHKNVVIVYDSGVEGDCLYLAMEWVEGEDLRSILDREGRLPPATVVAMVLQTADALEAVHTRMVHRDIKPANILVSGFDAAPQVYLTDFGIARPTTKGETITMVGAALGTPGYLSPEQAMGLSVDRRSDLYALGCVFFEAISGEPVFTASNHRALGQAHANNTLPSLVPVLGAPYEPFDRFLGTALAIDPDGRPSSASEFAAALEAAAIECGRNSGTKLVGGSDPTVGAQAGRSPHGPRTDSGEPRQGSRAGRLSNPALASRSKLAGNPVAFTTLALVVTGLAVGILAATGALTSPNSPPPHGPAASTQTSSGTPAATKISLQTGWKRPVNLGAAPLGSAPTGGADGSGDVYVFWAGTTDILWERWYSYGSWNGPQEIRVAGHGLAAQPAVAVHAGGQQDVFYKDTDGNLLETSHTNAWQKPLNLGSGPLGSAPTAGVDDNGDVYVFWRGTNGSLWDRWNVGEGWRGPGRIAAAGVGLATQPAVAVHRGGEQDVFYKGTDGNLWEISRVNKWQKPVDLGSGPLGSPPTAGVDANNVVYVFWKGTAGTLWATWNVGGHWTAATQITAAGHRLESQPVVAVHIGGEQDVFYKGTDENLWEISHIG